MKPVHMKSAMITQRELEDFAALRSQLDVLKRRVGEERERLIQLVDADAPVEPGRLQITVDEHLQQRITKAALVEAIGEEECEYLLSEIPPTVIRFLIVGEQARRWTSFVKEDGSWPS